MTPRSDNAFNISLGWIHPSKLGPTSAPAESRQQFRAGLDARIARQEFGRAKYDEHGEGKRN